jgi:hypothetical protein
LRAFDLPPYTALEEGLKITADFFRKAAGSGLAFRRQRS